MQEQILSILNSFGLGPRALILLLSAIPVTELRASIPIGILVLKQTYLTTFIYSVIGNILPIIPIYFFLEPLSKRLSRTKVMANFFNWLYARAKAKSGLVEKYEAIGLAIFVGIPFPCTGAWTGCLIASILRMRFFPAFIAISLGVIIAAILVISATLLGKSLFVTG